MKSLNTALLKIGLDNTDIEIYLAFLHSKDINITYLSNKIGVSRVSFYKSLEKLCSLELLSKNPNQKPLYSLNNPKQINTLLRIKQMEFTSVADQIEDLVENLCNDYVNDDEMPKIKTYLGKNNLTKFIVQSMSNPAINVDIFGGQDFFDLVDFDIWRSWLHKSLDNNKKIRIITDSNNFKLNKLGFINNLTIKKINGNFEHPGCYSFSLNSLIIWDTLDPKVTVINDKNTINIFRNQFNALWNLI